MKITHLKSRIKKLSTNKYINAKWNVKNALRKDILEIFYLDNIGFEKIRSKKAKVHWVFYLKQPLLDVSNCSSMIKILEDAIFTQDTVKQISKVTIEIKDVTTIAEPNKHVWEMVYIKIIEY